MNERKNKNPIKFNLPPIIKANTKPKMQIQTVFVMSKKITENSPFREVYEMYESGCENYGLKDQYGCIPLVIRETEQGIEFIFQGLVTID